MADQPTYLIMRQSRERTVEALIKHFAEDHLDLPEFESRLDEANRASTLDELERLTADLPAVQVAVELTASQASAPAPPPARAVAERRPLEPVYRRILVAIMSGVERRGRWKPPRRFFAHAFWGGIELDFRDAVLQPGVTEVIAMATMGGIDIVVPPDLPLEVTGFGILGGFDHEESDPPPEDDPDQPRLRISGFAVLGGVSVSVRLSGETAREASRRKKQERNAQRLEQKQRRRLR